MIISASRRTDIPAFYSRWLGNRLREGFVLVKNPRNPRQVRRISLAPEDVDGIVLWTKNPAPMLPMLSALEPYAYYFQFTLTPYGTDVEPGLPDKDSVMISGALKRLYGGMRDQLSGLLPEYGETDERAGSAGAAARGKGRFFKETGPGGGLLWIES